MGKLKKLEQEVDINAISIHKIRDFIELSYGIDLKLRTRKRTYAYARKVFCRIGYELGFGQTELAQFIGIKENDMVLYHSSTFHMIKPLDLMIYNKCIDKFNLPLQKYKTVRSISHNQRIDSIVYKLTSLSTKDLKFFENKVVDRFLKKVEEERAMLAHLE